MFKYTIEIISFIKDGIKQQFRQSHKEAKEPTQKEATAYDITPEEATEYDITATTVAMVLFCVPVLLGFAIGGILINVPLVIITAFIIDILLIPCAGIAWCINKFYK